MGRSAKLALCMALLASTAMAAGLEQNNSQSGRGSAGSGFNVINLVSNKQGRAANFDPDLVNAWGLSQAPGNPLWVSDNGSNKSTLYDPKTGAKVALTVQIRGGAPTGTVFIPPRVGGHPDFVVKHQGVKGASLFLFNTESGRIDGWSPSVNPNVAYTAVDNSANGAVYKGLAFGENQRLLFAANFSGNAVEVYDNRFHLVRSFTDPSLPARFAPFNVFVQGHNVFVAFAKREKQGDDEVDGAGLGYIDVFNSDGVLMTHLISSGVLNAPWGMAIAPQDFGPLAGSLLVGNFGDGFINAFDPMTGESRGTLNDANGAPIQIKGLWSLFRNGGGNITFSAGPQHEKNGLIGLIVPVMRQSTVAQN